MKEFYYYLPKKFWIKGVPVNPYTIEAESMEEAKNKIKEKHNLNTLRGCEIWEGILQNY